MILAVYRDTDFCIRRGPRGWRAPSLRLAFLVLVISIQVEWYRRGSEGAGRSEAHAIRSLPAVYGPLRGSVEHHLAPMRPLHLKGLVITRAGRH